MAKTENKVHNPLFHIVKREPLPFWHALAIRVVAVISALIVSALVITVLSQQNPLEVYKAMFEGSFGSSVRIWNLLQNLAMLLCVSLVVTPAFKMKFWNIGAEGQVLIGGLATIACMFFLGGKIPLPLLLVVMLTVSILAGIVWALLPAVSKALWNTNETLFTLMMNYIAIQLVAYFLKRYVKSGSGVLEPMPQYGLPIIGDMDYLLSIIIVLVLTVIVYVYLKHSKQGYEISVVGESVNTAKYIGINVKKVIIRTLAISGAIAGIAGFLLVGGINHTISTTTVGGRGFTAIMVSWLAKFNPLIMIITSFLIVFMERGAEQISSDFDVDPSISDILTGIILFFIIGCEFFLQYKIVFNKHRKEEA